MIKLWSILIGAVLFGLLSCKNDLDRVAAENPRAKPTVMRVGWLRLC